MNPRRIQTKSTNQRFPHLSERQPSRWILPKFVDDEVPVLFVNPRVSRVGTVVEEFGQGFALGVVDRVPIEPT